MNVLALRPFGPAFAPILLTPTMIAALQWGWTGRFEQALPAFERARRRCLEEAGRPSWST